MATPVEKITRVTAIAAGLPMWIIAVVARMRVARTLHYAGMFIEDRESWSFSRHPFVRAWRPQR